MADTAYPRPQLVRGHWQSLNGTGKFIFEDCCAYLQPTEPIAWTHAIGLPFPPESQASGIGDTGFHAVCWYAREFEVLPGQERVMLHFEAVDCSARVWIHGLLVAEHEGGPRPFCADITLALNARGPQRLTVRMEDDPLDLAKPRGKQDWQRGSHSIWYAHHRHLANGVDRAPGADRHRAVALDAAARRLRDRQRDPDRRRETRRSDRGGPAVARAAHAGPGTAPWSSA
jgi:hypothetical protein